MDILGATRTPEAFILDRRRTIQYVGRIDDRIGYRFKRAEANRSDLEEALKELLDGNLPSVKTTEPEGCRITRKSDLAKNETSPMRVILPSSCKLDVRIAIDRTRPPLFRYFPMRMLETGPR